MAKKKKQSQKPTVEGLRLLHKRSHRGYTDIPSMAMFPDAGEAVSRFVQDDFTSRARQDRIEAWEQQKGALEQTLETIKVQHGRLADVELRVIRRRIEALDRKLRSEAA